MSIRVTLNGEGRELEKGATLVDALASLGIEPDQKGVAVAVGLEVIPRRSWPQTELEDGAEIEVVSAAQGG